MSRVYRSPKDCEIFIIRQFLNAAGYRVSKPTWRESLDSIVGSIRPARLAEAFRSQKHRQTSRGSVLLQVDHQTLTARYLKVPFLVSD